MERQEASRQWFPFLEYLQEKPIFEWSEEVSKVFNLIHRHQPERIFTKIIEGIPVIVVVHSTKRGPALGGTRILLYRNMANAFRDGLKLASAMTYKAIWARLPLGGGKTVIFASPSEITPDFLKGYAEMLNDINAATAPKIQFITGEDIGFSESFADIVAKHTKYISGKSPQAGGLGDPSPRTAEGIFLAAKAIIEDGEIFHGTLDSKVLAVQGAGKVALPLIKMFLEAGSEVFFSEIDEKRAAEAAVLGARRLDTEEIYRTHCHILSPCAIGGVMNKATISALSPMCRLVIGAANNILDTPEDGISLHKARIFYAPDYVVNRWGLEWVSQEHQGVIDPLKARSNLTDIAKDILAIMRIWQYKDMPASELADTISRQLLDGEVPNIEEAFSLAFHKLRV